ncbi:unnamed protein product, partial [Tilletia laevis]
KKQRRLGGGGLGGGGLKFLTASGSAGAGAGAGAGASTSAGSGSASAGPSVSGMRKGWALSDENASLNPSSELGLPLALSPIKPGLGASRKVGGGGGAGGMPSFLSRR